MAHTRVLFYEWLALLQDYPRKAVTVVCPPKVVVQYVENREGNSLSKVKTCDGRSYALPISQKSRGSKSKLIDQVPLIQVNCMNRVPQRTRSQVIAAKECFGVQVSNYLNLLLACYDPSSKRLKWIVSICLSSGLDLPGSLSLPMPKFRCWDGFEQAPQYNPFAWSEQYSKRRERRLKSPLFVGTHSDSCHTRAKIVRRQRT